MTAADLKGIRAAHAKIKSLQARVDRLRAAMYSPSSPVLSHTPKGTDISDPTANAAVTVAGMTESAAVMITKKADAVVKADADATRRQ